MSLENDVKNIDKGRFIHLADALSFKEVCLKCTTFNQTMIRDPCKAYRCACMGQCTGVTLSSEMISYLLWQIGVKTERDHMRWIGP